MKQEQTKMNGRDMTGLPERERPCRMTPDAGHVSRAAGLPVLSAGTVADPEKFARVEAAFRQKTGLGRMFFLPYRPDRAEIWRMLVPELPALTEEELDDMEGGCVNTYTSDEVYAMYGRLGIRVPADR